jgi:uncharacterized tellurite resistance protein B-like protein
LDPAFALRVCELIAGIILTDGDLHPAENELLGRLLRDLKISDGPETVLSPTFTRGQAVQAIRDLPPEVRQEALERLIDAAIIDGKVVPAEQKYLDAVARAMGVRQDDLDERVTQRLLNG